MADTNTTRKAFFAGQFYSHDKEKLKEQIEECFLSDFGPKKQISKISRTERKNKAVKAVIAPHAGYAFSGPAAAFAYKEIAEAKLPDVFLVLGTNHSGMGTCLCSQDFETPLGIAKTDKEFVNLLSEKTGLDIDNAAHAHEHSIEVQIPFLQFVNKNNNKDKNSAEDFAEKTRIAALLVSHGLDAKETGKDIAEAVKESKKRITIIASSDFTHFGFNYGYIPFEPGPDSRDKIKELDYGAIEFIKKMDSKALLNYVSRTGATICGIAPITLLIEILNNLYKENKARVLKYYTSSDIISSHGSSVSYASVLFE